VPAHDAESQSSDSAECGDGDGRRWHHAQRPRMFPSTLAIYSATVRPRFFCRWLGLIKETRSRIWLASGTVLLVIRRTLKIRDKVYKTMRFLLNCVSHFIQFAIHGTQARQGGEARGEGGPSRPGRPGRGDRRGRFGATPDPRQCETRRTEHRECQCGPCDGS
jgi:hypothetical protein